MQPTPDNKSSWLDDRIANLPKITWEMVIFAVLLFAAVFTRFYDLESRVMSHDESLHTYYSWKLSTEGQYVHDPMMHGPFQFHVVSLAYTLLGDSDFSARVPAVLFGILSIAFLWAYRQYLGTLGVILAGVIFVISPYMLYYARYVRNESFVVLFGLVGMWSLLRYLDTGKSRYLLWLTASTALHFSTKETAFIYTAQMLIFLGLLFLQRVINQKWSSKLYRTLFLIMVVIAVVMFGIAIWEVMFATGGESTGTPTVVQPAIPDQSAESPTLLQTPTFIAVMEGGLGLVATILGLFFLARGIGLESLRKERSFSLILLLLTLILPQLTPLPVRFMGWPVPDTPGALQTMTLTEVLHFVIFLVPLVLVSVGIGVWWNRKVWLINAAVFYAIFTYLYTTGFTNPSGFLSGLVGSLGYWMAQQAVQRGSQPWYFYLLIQLPIYEYLAAFGSLTAIVIFTWRRLRQYISSEDHVLPEEIREEQDSTPTQNDPPSANPQTEAETVNALPEQSSETLALYLLIFWTISSFLAYTVAGEKMPWLTVHIALPMILLAGWGFAQVMHGIPWQEWRSSRGGLTLVVLIVFVLSLFGGLGVLLGGNPPFQSRMQADLQTTTRFLSILVILGLSGWGLFRLIANWKTARIARMGFLILVGLGVLLTLRTSLQANYVNYDQANEYLVYAHSARGVKDVMERINDISMRTTDGMALQFGYDDDTSWPLTWYTRNYPNTRYYGNQPGKDLRDLPVIVVGDNNYGKIEPVVGQAYYRFDYIRMVWPNQDYFNLTLARLWDAIDDPAMRSALFQVWLNRDFSAYSEATGREVNLENWSPADTMRLYIRKDVAARLWDYAAAPVSEEIVADPYEGGEVDLIANQAIGSLGSQPGQFLAPRDVALAPDGSLYITDTENNRIQHLSAEGEVLHIWGSFADATAGDAPGSTFNQPWGIAVGPDGSVYVADTWNHRIQKFTPEGELLTMWGYFGQAETPDAFWGPRDVAVDNQGRVFVVDTGNKRVVVFDANGAYLNQFGGFGLEAGKFDEPVGITIDSAGQVYVADTWNQRIQVFQEAEGVFYADKIWEVAAWYGQSLDNKPYITVNAQGQIFISDPESPRVIEFDPLGQFVRYWGGFSPGLDGFSLINGLAAENQSGIWVVDSGAGRILHFTLP